MLPVLPGPQTTPSLPVETAILPPDSPEVSLGPPPAPPQPNGFAVGLQRALPIILATLARSRGGPLAGAGLLQGYTAAQQAQRDADEAQRKLEAAQAATEQERQAKADEQTRKRQMELENFIEHQAQILNDPKNGFTSDPQAWAATVSRADLAARKIFGAPAGYVSAHPGLQYSDAKAQAKARDDAQAALDAAQKNLGPETWAKMLEQPEGYAIGQTSLADLLATAKFGVTQEGKPVVPGAKTPPPAVGTLERFIFDKYGASPTPAQQLEGRRLWMDQAGGGAGAPDLSVKPETINFFSQAALSGVRVNDVIPAFGMGSAAVKAKSAFLDGIAEQAKTLGIDGHTFGAMLVDSRAKQQAYTNAQKLGTQTRINETQAKKNFAQLVELAGRLDNKRFQTSIPILNEWIRSGVVNLTGDSDVNNFLGVLTETLTEYAKVVSGQTTGAGVTNHANAQAQALIGKGLNATTIRNFKAQAEQAMKNRIASFDEALKGLFGDIQSLEQRRDGGLGEEPTPAGMVKMRAPNGQVKAVPADQVSHYQSLGAVVVK